MKKKGESPSKSSMGTHPSPRCGGGNSGIAVGRDSGIAVGLSYARYHAKGAGNGREYGDEDFEYFFPV